MKQERLPFGCHVPDCTPGNASSSSKRGATPPPKAAPRRSEPVDGPATGKGGRVGAYGEWEIVRRNILAAASAAVSELDAACKREHAERGFLGGADRRARRAPAGPRRCDHRRDAAGLRSLRRHDPRNRGSPVRLVLAARVGADGGGFARHGLGARCHGGTRFGRITWCWRSRSPSLSADRVDHGLVPARNARRLHLALGHRRLHRRCRRDYRRQPAQELSQAEQHARAASRSTRSWNKWGPIWATPPGRPRSSAPSPLSRP